MRIVYNKILPPKGFIAINLFGILFVREGTKELSAKTINHEQIHTKQMKELLYIFFYIWYGIEWLIGLIQYRDTNKAYYNISFEREAYDNDDNLFYLFNRKLFAFTKYIF